MFVRNGSTITDLINSWMVLSSEDCVNNTCNTPNWGGFMSKIFNYKIDEAISSRILILLFTLGLPSELTTIFSDLMYARNISNMDTLFVTFEQPLYLKAIKIVYSFPELFQKSMIKLGEFHLMMSYLGRIGYIMAGSGLKDLWATVYAEHSTVHMLSGQDLNVPSANQLSAVDNKFKH